MVGNPSRKISRLNSEIVAVRVLPDGKMIWTPGEVFLTKCYPDIYRYPYDAQECYISIVPWGALPSEIILNCPEEEIVTPHYKDNGEWILKKTKAIQYVEDNLPVAKFYFTYSRRPQFFVVNVILPIVLLSYLNCLVFVIPTESGERVSYSITVLLSFAVFMTLVGDNIPKTSAPMSLLCYYLISVFSGSTMVMVSTIFNTRVFYRDPTVPISTAYRMVVKLTTKEFKKHTKVQPASKASELIIAEPVDDKGLPTKQTSETETDEGQNERAERQRDIAWKDVAHAMDTISMFVFLLYFTACTLCQLLFIAIPKSY